MAWAVSESASSDAGAGRDRRAFDRGLGRPAAAGNPEHGKRPGERDVDQSHDGQALRFDSIRKKTRITNTNTARQRKPRRSGWSRSTSQIKKGGRRGAAGCPQPVLQPASLARVLKTDPWAPRDPPISRWRSITVSFVEKSHQAARQSVRVGADDLALGSGAQGAVGDAVDRLLDRGDADRRRRGTATIPGCWLLEAETDSPVQAVLAVVASSHCRCGL